jgi:hypothetical protein
VRTAASFRAAGDVARVLVGEVWLRADGAGGGGFAKCSGMAKALASAALRGIAERDVLADVAFPVEKQHLGVPQLGGADKSDDHGGGGLALSILSGGEPSRRLGQLRSWVEHLELFTGVFWRGGGGDPIQNVSCPSLADVGRYGQTSQPYKPVQESCSAAASKPCKLVPKCAKSDSSGVNDSDFTHLGTSFHSFEETVKQFSVKTGPQVCEI